MVNIVTTEIICPSMHCTRTRCEWIRSHSVRFHSIPFAGFLCLPQIFFLALASGRLCLYFSRSRLENTAVFLKYVAKSNELLLQCEYKIKKRRRMKSHKTALSRNNTFFLSPIYFYELFPCSCSHSPWHFSYFIDYSVIFSLFHLELLHRNLILFIFIALEHTHDFLFLLLIIYRQSLGFRWGF